MIKEQLEAQQLN